MILNTIRLSTALLVAGSACLGCSEKVPEPKMAPGLHPAAASSPATPGEAAPIQDQSLVTASPGGSGSSQANPVNAAYAKDRPQDPSVHEVPGVGPMNGTLMPANAGQVKVP